MHETATRTLTVPEAIQTRRSIRAYEQKPIPREDLDEILRLTSLAPSAFNIQPWRFIVVTDPELKERVKEAAYGQRQIGSAPAVIVLYSDMEDMMEHPREVVHPGMSEQQKDAAVQTLKDSYGKLSVAERALVGVAQANIALGYLLVAAQGLGYATSPMLGFDRDKMREVLGLKDHVRFASIVAIGRAAEEGFPHHRHELDRIVTYK
ncbi:MAG: dehydrogenase [Firmicutes bacterium]|nr:dehydrogenase [Bacillota bacterium]